MIIKDINVILTDYYTFRDYINCTVSQSVKMFGVIKRVYTSFPDAPAVFNVYTTFL